MATNTYVALKSSTVTGSNAATVLLDNIPQGYTDLVLVIQGRFDTSGQTIREFRLRFNGDTGTNYSSTRMIGDGSSASSDRLSNFSNMRFGVFPAANSTSGILGTAICHIQNYSSTSVYKTVLNRTSDPQGWVTEAVGLWRNSAAITSVEVAISETQTGNWLVGSTFTIYGIAAEGALAKATGGAIYSDSQYWYHAFAASGTFTPTQSLTADILVVAGGASGGGQYAGGGGAGGVCFQSARSLTTTGYTVTVGAGGAAITSSASNGNAGSNSVFDTITALGGGGGGSWNSSGANGATGGSGGGGSMGTSSGNTTSGGAATQGTSGGATGYGNAGGGGLRSGSYFLGGGGGGAGATGGTASGTLAGAGGAGLNTWSSWLTTVGAGLDGYIAGGGGGGAEAGTRGAGGAGGGGNGGQDNSGANALANSGSGGGGVGYNATRNSGSGGSGIVIVRYAK